MIPFLNRFIVWLVSQILDHRKAIWLFICAAVVFIQWAVKFATGHLMRAVNDLVSMSANLPGYGSVDMSGIDSLTGGFVGWCMQILPLEVLISCCVALVALQISVAAIRLVINVYKLIPLKAS
jgi:hypothetical protein